MCDAMLNVVRLTAIRLSVVMLSGIILDVVAPVKLASIFPELEKAEFLHGRLIKAFSSGVDLSGNDSSILQIYST